MDTSGCSSTTASDHPTRFPSRGRPEPYGSELSDSSQIGSGPGAGKIDEELAGDRRGIPKESSDQASRNPEYDDAEHFQDDRRNDDPNDRERKSESEERQHRARSGFRRSLGDKLLSGLFESGEVLRRGQGIVSEVAQVTKGELVRIVGAEVRTFLDKVDVSDLVQEIMSGLVLEVKTEVRFTRDSTGKIRPKAQETQTRFRSSSNRSDDESGQSEST